MRRSLVWLRLKWPRDVDEECLVSAWRVIAHVAGQPVVVETLGTSGGVTHRLAVPYSRQQIIMRQLRSVIPGLDITEDNGEEARPPFTLDMALTLGTNTRYRSLKTEDVASASRAVLTALAATRRGEVLVLQWVLGRQLHPRAVPSRASLPTDSWLESLLVSLRGETHAPDAERRRALATKRSEAGWRAIGRIAVKAADEHRRRHLLSQLLGALRTAEGPGVQLNARRSLAKAVVAADLPLHWNLRLNILELAAVSGWPTGKTADLPVTMTNSRLVKPSRLIPRRGVVLGEATFPGDERPLALSTLSLMRHLCLTSPTGTGKSTNLLVIATQLIEQGHAVVVIEPNGDLIGDLLARIPDKRKEDVVVFDPADDVAPVGFNPLEARGRPPALVADQLLSLFHTLYASSWGPRTADLLATSFATLARIRGMTLPYVPLLLQDKALRRRVVGQVRDPLGLDPAWAAFEAWSDAERTAAIAPALNKTRQFLVNPRLRAVLGQAQPRFDLGQLFHGSPIFLASLAKGQLGPESASLIGAMLMSALWQEALGRASLPPNKRKPLFIILDEFADFLRLPIDLADALAMARGLNVSFIIAHQHLGQLDSGMRAALANTRSRICYQLGHDDAVVMARGSGLDPEDFESLPAFHFYARLVAGDAVQPWCSVRSLPAPPAISDPDQVRALSRERYGVPVTDTEAALAAAVGYQPRTTPGAGADDLAPRKRQGGSS